MRKGVEVRLRPGDRKRLEAVVDDRKSPQHGWRVRIVLMTADGLFRDASRDRAFSGASPEQVAAVVKRTLRETPLAVTHWTLRSMAKANGLAPSTIHRIWREQGLKPHQIETFKLSNDPRFVEKIRDIVGLYVNPPEHALALSVDEK